MLAVEHALGRLWIRGPRQGATKRHSGIDELLMSVVDQQYSCLVSPERVGGLFVECGKIAARKGSGRRECLKRDRGTVKLAIEVPAQILGDLQGPAFNFSLLETGHAVEGKDGDCEERQSQRQGEQAKERSNALGRDPVYDRWHGVLWSWRRTLSSRFARIAPVKAGAKRPSHPHGGCSRGGVIETVAGGNFPTRPKKCCEDLSPVWGLASVICHTLRGSNLSPAGNRDTFSSLFSTAVPAVGLQARRKDGHLSVQRQK